MSHILTQYFAFKINQLTDKIVCCYGTTVTLSYFRHSESSQTIRLFLEQQSVNGSFFCSSINSNSCHLQFKSHYSF